MKYTKISNALLMLSFILIVGACQKEYTTVPSKKDSIMDMMEELKSTPQKFTGQAGQSWSITGNKGTRVRFNPRSFKDNNNVIITSGMIDVELIETPKAKDMLLNGVTTISGYAQLLKSGGAINIKFTQNGDAVQVGDGYAIDFLQDSASTDTMSLFVGATNQSTTGNGFTFWGEWARDPQDGTNVDTASALNFYTFDSVLNYNWINCDQFNIDPRPTTDIEVELTGKTAKENGAVVFVILPEVNAVVPFYQYDLNNLGRLNLGKFMKIPIGMKAKFVALAKINSEYYFAKKENVVISNNHTLSLKIGKKTLADIKNEINAL